jgi:hypothetical protein
MDEAVPGVSGVNKEMLGVVERDQAGILDHQRKQAAYAVLAGFFDSLRRYRRQQGRHLLKLITKYMSDGRLIRIVGRQGNVQYLPLIRDPDVSKYDVIVDEAPAGPNQKERTFMFLQSPFGAEVMKNAPPQIQLKFLEYTPLPVSLVSDIQKMAEEMPEQKDPALVKAEMDAQIRQQQMKMDGEEAVATFQMKKQEAEATLAAKREEAAAMIALKREDAAATIQVMREKAQAEYDLAIQKAESEKQLALLKMQAEFDLAQQKMEMEEELENRRIDSQEKVGLKKASVSGNGSDTKLSKNRPGGSLSE